MFTSRILRRVLLAEMILLLSTALSASAQQRSPAPGRVRLVLPPVIYAVPGIETNIYFDNVVLVLNPANYAFEAICDKGMQLSERWTFTPKDEDVGEYPIEIIVRDENNAVIARATSKVRVTPKRNDHPGLTTLLLVGASLTEYSIYPQQLLDLDKRDGWMRLKLIGSRGPDDAPPTGELRHEGYSGWTAEAFVTLHGPLSRSGYLISGKTGSPFVYETQPRQYRLDFARYCEQFNGGHAPDAITIHLIVNDIFTATDETIEKRITTMIGYFDQLVAEFHRVRPDTRIGIILTAPPSRSQDGFRNYIGAGHQTRWQYRRDLHRAYERMIEHYAGQEAKFVYLVPEYVNLDTERDYPTWTAPANARSSEAIARVSNGPHPNPDGYAQMADSIYCWLKAVIADSAKQGEP